MNQPIAHSTLRTARVLTIEPAQLLAVGAPADRTIRLESGSIGAPAAVAVPADEALPDEVVLAVDAAPARVWEHGRGDEYRLAETPGFKGYVSTAGR